MDSGIGRWHTAREGRIERKLKMKNALNNTTSMISTISVDTSFWNDLADADQRRLDAMDAAQAEEDAQSEREQVEYSNALVTFGDLVDGGTATVAELNVALDELMSAAHQNVYGQDVVREADECVKNSAWRINWGNEERGLVPRLTLANVRRSTEYDTSCLMFEVVVDGKTIGESLEWLDDDGDVVRTDCNNDVNPEVFDAVFDAALEARNISPDDYTKYQVARGHLYRDLVRLMEIEAEKLKAA